MKYISELQEKKIFNMAYVIELTGNDNTAKCLIQTYLKKGYIIRIKQNMYAATELVGGNVIANHFEIGSMINDNAYISHHSALEFHGYANQVYYEVTVSSRSKFKEFSFDGISYSVYSPKITDGVIVPLSSPLIRVTDIERTVIDCIYDITRSGGIEEVLECFNLIPYLDEEKLLHYLAEYNQIYLYQKTGYILEAFKGKMALSDNFFNKCERNINNRKKNFTDGYYGKQVYHSKWKLYAPENPLEILNQGDDELV